MTEVSIEPAGVLGAETLARRALAVVLNSPPGSQGSGRRLFAPDPDAARGAVAILRDRTQPGPLRDLAIELLERCGSGTGAHDVQR